MYGVTSKSRLATVCGRCANVLSLEYRTRALTAGIMRNGCVCCDCRLSAASDTVELGSILSNVVEYRKGAWSFIIGFDLKASRTLVGKGWNAGRSSSSSSESSDGLNEPIAEKTTLGFGSLTRGRSNGCQLHASHYQPVPVETYSALLVSPILHMPLNLPRLPLPMRYRGLLCSRAFERRSCLFQRLAAQPLFV